MELKILDESFMLLGNKMVWWPRKRTLLIADTHFGKAATFREAGIPVPEGGVAKMLDEIAISLRRWQAKRLLILGDFFHATTRGTHQYESQLCRWREQNAEIECVLVRGNHDRGHRQLLQDLNLTVYESSLQEGPFCFCHDPEQGPGDSSFLFAGHLHPAVRVKFAPRKEVKLPCFYFRPDRLVLPAFGVFTGTKVIDAKSQDRFFAVVEGEIIEVAGN